MTDSFYEALEDKYRGSRDLIKSRLKIYLPFISLLHDQLGDASAIDLGCGRGEWLELLAEENFQSIGIDRNSQMIEGCSRLGLNVVEQDAIAYLKSVDDESASIISAFHVIEHIEFSQLQVLISQAHRILKPGGLLILETPNPENLSVGTKSFYLDPTHKNPVPSELLSFAAVFAGFDRTKTMFLQENPDILAESSTDIYDVLTGVSPDYAVIGQKGGNDDLAIILNDLFSTDFGVTLQQISHQYDHQLREHKQSILARTAQSEQQLNELATAAEHARQRADAVIEQSEQSERRLQNNLVRTEEKLENLEAELTTRIEQLVAQQQIYELRINALLTSLSWRITSPLRILLDFIKWQFKLPFRLVAFIFRPILKGVMAYLLAQTKLRADIVASTSKLPWLHEHLINFAEETQLVEPPKPSTASNPEPPDDEPVDLSSLTPGAQRIYSELQAEVRKQAKD